MLARLTLLVLCVALGGCQYDPHAHLLTLTEPKPQEVVGTYIVDRFDFPPELAGESADITVELRVDGSFSATNVPPWQLELPGTGFSKTLLSGTGKWVIAKMGQLDPGAHPIYGIYLRNGPPRTSPAPPGEDPLKGLMAPADFTGEKPPYGLIFQIGDPDSGCAILLKRKP